MTPSGSSGSGFCFGVLVVDLGMPGFEFAGVSPLGRRRLAAASRDRLRALARFSVSDSVSGSSEMAEGEFAPLRAERVTGAK